MHDSSSGPLAPPGPLQRRPLRSVLLAAGVGKLSSSGSPLWRCRARALAAAATVDRPVRLAAVDRMLYLSASAFLRKATETDGTYPANVNGLTIHYRWADAACVGQWRHPLTGTLVPIDRDRIDVWVKAIKLARFKGVNLPVVKDHQETADNTVGELFDARRRGNRLEVLLGLKGNDSLRIAQRNYLSIGIDPDFKDSHGCRYGEAIRHVAVTPVPVIHGQRGFVSLSRHGADRCIVRA